MNRKHNTLYSPALKVRQRMLFEGVADDKLQWQIFAMHHTDDAGPACMSVALYDTDEGTDFCVNIDKADAVEIARKILEVFA
jgi:hypothetical protein